MQPIKRQQTNHITNKQQTDTTSITQTKTNKKKKEHTHNTSHTTTNTHPPTPRQASLGSGFFPQRAHTLTPPSNFSAPSQFKPMPKTP
jgi:hypothetical protein